MRTISQNLKWHSY